ncbi:MAG: TonB-dependent receptor [Bacteroidales bacterium]|nr:TonB-dependent receptor [Bacteroidales bacterium]
MKKLIISTVLAAMIGGLQAQNHSVTGTLRDAKSGEPMAFTNCVLLRTTDSSFVAGSTTNDRGAMRFAAVEQGEYLLRISAVGYDTYWQHLNVPPDTALGVIEIFQSSTTLQAVNITAQRPLYSADGEKVFYHVEDDPSVQTGTMADALQNAPGVEVDPEGNITLRGSSDVTVWLNDRPSNLSGEALKQYIKTLPASSVKRVEVLSNPSARYGSTGAIINIITDQRVQLNSLLSIGLNASTTPYLQPWLSYVWANEMVSVNAWANGNFSNFDVSTENSEQLYESIGRLSMEYSYSGKELQRRVSGNAGASVDWQIDSVTSLSAWLNISPGRGKVESHYDIARQEYIYNPGDHSYRSDILVPNNWFGLFGGVGLDRKLDTLGQKLSLYIGSNYNPEHTVRDKERQYAVMQQYDMRNRRTEDYTSQWNYFDLDYTKPFSQSTTMEAGASVVLGRNSQQVQWDTMDYATGQWMRDADRTFSTRMVDNELNAYVAVQQKISRLTLKGGVRAYRKWKQATFTDLPVETTQYDVDKAFWDFIPSLHASYATESGHTFTFSYTRRFSSPGSKLWSTYTWLGVEDYELGDPDLRFSHTHNLEGGWTMYKPWGSVGLTGYLRANTDEIQQLSDVAYHPYYGRIVSFSQWANIGDSRTLGAEANVTWRPRPFMNIRLYANLYDYYYNMEFRPGEWDERHLTTFSGRLNVTGKLWDVLQIYANARYSTAALSLLSKSQPSFQLDLGASADLLEGRLSLFLNWQDILATAQSGTVGLNPYYQSSYSYTWGRRAVTVGATWRIGKMELQSRAREGVSAPTL